MSDELKEALKKAGYIEIDYYPYTWFNAKDLIIFRLNGNIEIHDYDRIAVVLTEETKLIRYLKNRIRMSKKANGMTQKENLLAAWLLNLADGEFTNHGCNDLPEEVLSKWTKPELVKLWKDYHEYNKTPLENIDDWEGMEFTDDMLMGLMAHKLKNE